MLTLSITDGEGIVLAGCVILAHQGPGRRIKLVIEAPEAVRVMRTKHLHDPRLAAQAPWAFQLQRRVEVSTPELCIGGEPWETWVDVGQAESELAELAQRVENSEDGSLRVVHPLTGEVLYTRQGPPDSEPVSDQWPIPWYDPKSRS